MCPISGQYLLLSSDGSAHCGAVFRSTVRLELSSVGPVYPSGVQLDVLATPSGAPLQSDHVIHKDNRRGKIMLISALLFAYPLAVMGT